MPLNAGTTGEGGEGMAFGIASAFLESLAAIAPDSGSEDAMTQEDYDTASEGINAMAQTIADAIADAVNPVIADFADAGHEHS